MVGASMVGEIRLNGVVDVRTSVPEPMSRKLEKGDEIGHFRFGSTVVLILPPGLRRSPSVSAGDAVRMGQELFVG